MGRISLSGCIGLASCKLNVRSVCVVFIYKNPGALSRQRVKERKEEKHPREKQSSMLTLYHCSGQNIVVNWFATASVVTWQVPLSISPYCW